MILNSNKYLDLKNIIDDVILPGCSNCTKQQKSDLDTDISKDPKYKVRIEAVLIKFLINAYGDGGSLSPEILKKKLALDIDLSYGINDDKFKRIIHNYINNI